MRIQTAIISTKELQQALGDFCADNGGIPDTVIILYKGCWYPCVNPKLSRDGGRTALKIWRQNGSLNKYRLVQYGRRWIWVTD